MALTDYSEYVKQANDRELHEIKPCEVVTHESMLEKFMRLLCSQMPHTSDSCLIVDGDET